MSWKKDTLVRMVIKLPTCGTLLNMPLQLDFVEHLIDNEEEQKKFVLLCERQFNAGVPSHTIYEIKKPDEHSYSKNNSEIDSEMEEFDRRITSLSKLSSDEDIIVQISDDEKESEEKVNSRLNLSTSLSPYSLNESLDEQLHTNSRSASPQTDETRKKKDAKEETKKKESYLGKLTECHPKQGIRKAVSTEKTAHTYDDDWLKESQDEAKYPTTSRTFRARQNVGLTQHTESHPPIIRYSTPNHESRGGSSKLDSQPISSYHSSVENRKTSTDRQYFHVRENEGSRSSVKSQNENSKRRTYETKRDSRHGRKEKDPFVKSEIERYDRRRNLDSHKSHNSKKKDHRSRSPIDKRRLSNVSSSSYSDNGSPSYHNRSRSSSPDFPGPKYSQMVNRSLKDLVKESKKAVNSSYGSYTQDGKLSIGKSTVKCQQVEFYCLRKLEFPIRIPEDQEEIKLSNAGLGSKVIEVPLNQSGKEMKNLIRSNFPSLKGDFIIACRLKRGDKVLKPVFKEVPTMAQLLQKAPTKTSTMYVVPYEEIDIADREERVRCSICNNYNKVSKRFEHHLKCSEKNNA